MTKTSFIQGRFGVEKKPKHRQVIRPQVELTAWNDVRDGEKTKGSAGIRQCDATDGLHTELGTAALSRDQDKHDEAGRGENEAA